MIRTIFFFIPMLISIITIHAQPRVQDMNIKFIVPPNVDSVMNELVKYVDESGLIDSIIVEWTRRGPKIDSYSFYRVEAKDEFDSTGKIQNRQLWLKKRTNRVLKIGDRYEIPLIHHDDQWAYTFDVEGYPIPHTSFSGLGNEYTPSLSYENNVFPVTDIWTTWRFIIKEDGEQILELGMQSAKLEIK